MQQTTRTRLGLVAEPQRGRHIAGAFFMCASSPMPSVVISQVRKGYLPPDGRHLRVRPGSAADRSRTARSRWSRGCRLRTRPDFDVVHRERSGQPEQAASAVTWPSQPQITIYGWSNCRPAQRIQGSSPRSTTSQARCGTLDYYSPFPGTERAPEWLICAPYVTLVTDRPQAPIRQGAFAGRTDVAG